MRCPIRTFILFLTGFVFLGASGCSDAPEKGVSQYVIKAGSIMISSEEFTEELDLKLAAYPYDFKKNTIDYNQMVFDLVSIFSDECVLLSAAIDAGIQISDAELVEAEAFVREDYPEDSFDKMLLENAISYPYWKKRLNKNLIMDKFIQQALRDKIEILPEDVVSFYNRHVSQESEKEPSGVVSDENKLVLQLRLEKSQESYDGWITELKKQYPVEINKKALTLFLIDMEKSKGQTND